MPGPGQANWAQSSGTDDLVTVLTAQAGAQTKLQTVHPATSIKTPGRCTGAWRSRRPCTARCRRAEELVNEGLEVVLRNIAQTTPVACLLEQARALRSPCKGPGEATSCFFPSISCQSGRDWFSGLQVSPVSTERWHRGASRWLDRQKGCETFTAS